MNNWILLIILLQSIILCNGLHCGELYETDIDFGGSLRQWGSSYSNGSSLLLVMTGNSEFHLQELKLAIHCIDSISSINISDLIFILDASPNLSKDISNWLTNRVFMNRIPWSIIFVRNSESIDEEMMRSLIVEYSNKLECGNKNKPDFILNCGKLLLVLSTRIAQAFSGFSAQGSVEIQKLRKTSESDWRMLFPAIGTYSRRFLRPIVGPMSIVRAQGIVRSILQSQLANEEITLGICKDGPIDERLLDIKYSRFIGQQIVVSQIKTMLGATRQGLKTSDNPLMMLFVGAAGLGKTYLASIIADAYNCGVPKVLQETNGCFSQIAMVNFKSEHDIDALVGAVPGVKGNGILVDIFSKCERPVIVLDEIEKAHSKLLDILLPMTDTTDAALTSKKTGQVFSTKNAIFILTTNCLAHHATALSLKQSFMTEAHYDTMASQMAKLLRNSSVHCDMVGRKNPFASDPLWRRLLAGHALANEHGLFVFTPPTKTEIDELSILTLNHYSKSLRHGRVFFTDGVVAFLQEYVRKLFRREFDSLATIGPYIESQIANVLLDQSIALDDSIDILVFIDRYGHLSAIAVPRVSQDTLSEEKHTDEKITQSENVMDVSREKKKPDEYVCDEPVISSESLASPDDTQIEVAHESEFEFVPLLLYMFSWLWNILPNALMSISVFALVAFAPTFMFAAVAQVFVVPLGALFLFTKLTGVSAREVATWLMVWWPHSFYMVLFFVFLYIFSPIVRLVWLGSRYVIWTLFSCFKKINR